MTIRSFHERIIQTTSFELIGIAFVSPVYAQLAGASIVDGFALVTLLSIAILIWSPIYNTIFDRLEKQYSDRLACERPHDLRIVHALMHEITAVILTCPLLIWIGGHTLGGALAFNIGLTITYSVYTYVFHIAYDRLRPVQKAPYLVKAQ